MNIIAITGGIGSGKSIVRQILTCLNYTVYDCDSEAKRIMDESSHIKDKIKELIHPDAVLNGIINRNLISNIVFNNTEKLAILNSIVHAAVADDIINRANNKPEEVLFIETAILYQSNLDKIVKEVWNVTAPVDLRVSRVMKRNNCSAVEVLKRIESQDLYIVNTPHSNTHVIINDNITPLLPQIHNLLHNLN